jgi:hypothetical protein
MMAWVSGPRHFSFQQRAGASGAANGLPRRLFNGRVFVPLALGCCLPYVRKKVVVRVASRGLLDAKAHCARAAL